MVLLVLSRRTVSQCLQSGHDNSGVLAAGLESNEATDSCEECGRTGAERCTGLRAVRARQRGAGGGTGEQHAAVRQAAGRGRGPGDAGADGGPGTRRRPGRAARAGAHEPLNSNKLASEESTLLMG